MELPKSLKLLIFDFDGTLFHLDVDWDALRRDLGELPHGEKLGDAIERWNAENDPLIETVTRHELRAVNKRRLDASTAAALLDLSPRYDLAVCTRNSRRAVEASLASTPVEDKLYIAGREDVKRLKPDPEGIHYILKHFQRTPAEAALIGDTTHDVEAALGAGILSIVVKNERLAFQPEGANYYIESIGDLAAAG